MPSNESHSASHWFTATLIFSILTSPHSPSPLPSSTLPLIFTLHLHLFPHPHTPTHSYTPTSDVDGSTYDLAEGCGLCSPNKPLDQLKNFSPALSEELREQMESLDHDLNEALKQAYNDTHSDSHLLFFKIFDPDNTFPPYVDETTGSPARTTVSGDDSDCADQQSSPLRFLGCAAMPRESTVEHVLIALDRLIKDNYRIVDTQSPPNSSPVLQYINVPERWSRGLIYTICRSLQDCHTELSCHNEGLQTSFFPDMGRTVSSVCSHSHVIMLALIDCLFVCFSISFSLSYIYLLFLSLIFPLILLHRAFKLNLHLT